MLLLKSLVFLSMTTGHGAADVPPAERLLPAQQTAASFCYTATFSPGANLTLAINKFLAMLSSSVSNPSVLSNPRIVLSVLLIGHNSFDHLFLVPVFIWAYNCMQCNAFMELIFVKN
jgi:hypothetical protein